MWFLTSHKFNIVAGGLLAAFFILCGGYIAAAKDILVTKNLQTAIEKADAGDRLLLSDGQYLEPIIINKPIQIIGVGEVTLKGNGKGHVITITSPDVRLSGLTVTGSGLLLETQDSGIFLSKEATGAIVENCRLENNLIGVYIWGAKKALVRNNIIRGRQDLRVNERGNGVQIWNAPGAIVEGNDIQYGRDGIFVTTRDRKSVV